MCVHLYVYRGVHSLTVQTSGKVNVSRKASAVSIKDIRVCGKYRMRAPVRADAATR